MQATNTITIEGKQIGRGPALFPAWQMPLRSQGKTRLTLRDLIARGVARGKVDERAAVEGALLAFGDGLYFVFVDDAQQESLDAPVRLRPDSRVTFLRLVALAGG